MELNSLFVYKIVGFISFIFKLRNHRRRKYGGSSPNSLRPISYFGSIWELYVLDPKTNVFCRKKIQLHFPMNKRLTVPIIWLEIPKIPPKISAQFVCPSPKFSNFWKKALSGLDYSGCPLSVKETNNKQDWKGFQSPCSINDKSSKSY